MSVLEIAKGMGVTLSHLFKKPVTVQYPDEKVDVKPRFRGRHHLLRHPGTGLEKCIGCSLCAAACPAYAIYVEAAENDPDAPTSAGERYAAIYEINMLRCIFCGFCEEACPTGAIVLGHEFELADFRYDDFVYGKDDMLVGTKGSKWQRREAAKEGKSVDLGLSSGPRPELEGVEY
jgi:NADH-quinone oxidoreductase subunit I